MTRLPISFIVTFSSNTYHTTFKLSMVGETPDNQQGEISPDTWLPLSHTHNNRMLTSFFGRILRTYYDV